jgi:hypothetical protein
MKLLSWINILGFSLVTMLLVILYLLKPFAWGDLWIGLSFYISIPFIISGIVLLRNIEEQNLKQIKFSLIAIFLILWLPTIALPFFYELGGLIICMVLLLIGIWGIFKIKNQLDKLTFFNKIGIFFLF